MAEDNAPLLAFMIMILRESMTDKQIVELFRPSRVKRMIQISKESDEVRQ